VKTATIQGADINITGSSKIAVKSKGHTLDLAGGGAKLAKGGECVECKSGQVLIKGTEVSAE